MRRLSLAFVAMLLLLPTAAAALCTLPAGLRTDERPDPQGPPTEIAIKIHVLDVLGIDDANQQIEIDMAVVLAWHDPRLIGLEGCRFGLTEVWFPDLMLVNSSSLRASLTQALNQVIVGPGGRVDYVQRYAGQISSYHTLSRFPFDRQAIEIELTTRRSLREEVVLVPEAEGVSVRDRLNIEGWQIEGATVSEVAFQPLGETGEVSRLTLTIDANRISSYYVLRLILPLLFVVMMSWANFWLPPERYEFQIGLGATSMLTAIAFALSMSNKLPTLGYLTILDKMLIWAVFLIFLSIAEGVVAGRLVMKDARERARQLDRACRLVFPLLLVFGWGALAL